MKERHKTTAAEKESTNKKRKGQEKEYMYQINESKRSAFYNHGIMNIENNIVSAVSCKSSVCLIPPVVACFASCLGLQHHTPDEKG